MKTSHQKNWLVGRYAVLETLRAARWPVVELFISDDIDDELVAEIRRLTAATTTSFETVSHERLTQLCHAGHHQGLAARMADFPCLNSADLQQILARSRHRNAAERPPLIVICDRIQDAFNFGAILRCCDAMLATAVVIGNVDQVAVTPQVARSSAGAVNHLNIVCVDDVILAARTVKAAGCLLVGACERSQVSPWSVDLSAAVALIVGSEAFGISPDLLDLCDEHVAIPMLGQVASLNAAAAAGILLYEIRRQQTLHALAKPGSPATTE